MRKNLLSHALVILLPALLISAAAVGTQSSAGDASEKYTFAVNGTFDYDRASDIHTLLNQLRSETGLSALDLDTQLSEAAMQRAVETAIYYEHTRPDGSSPAKLYPSGWSRSAENIMCGGTSPADVIAHWRAASADLDNMLSSDYTTVGVGCFYQNETMYWTLELCDGSYSTVSTQSGKTVSSKTVTALGAHLSLSLAPDAATLTIGETQRFSLYSGSTQIVPSFYETGDTGVATVSSDGVVAATGGGSTVIRLGVGSNFYKEHMVTVTGIPLTYDMFTVDTAASSYTGNPTQKEVLSSRLTQGEDYALSYADNTNAGTATLTITGRGSYSGALVYSFPIHKASLTLTDSPSFPALLANDAKNASLAALTAAVQDANETFSASFAETGSATLTADWSLQAGQTFRAQGGTYTFEGVLTPADGTNFSYSGGKETLLVTVSPVTGRGSYAPAALTKAKSELNAAVSLSDLGLPTAITVTYDSDVPTATYPVVGWNDTLAQLKSDSTAAGDIQRVLTPTVTLPGWATIDTSQWKTTLTLTEKFPVTVTVTAPATITYGNQLGNPSAVQTAISNDTDSGATWSYFYKGTTRAGSSYRSAEQPTQAGIYYVTATLVSSTHSGAATSAAFTIAPKAVTSSMVTVSGSYTFTGRALTPTYTVSDGTLMGSADYTAVVSDHINAGTGLITVTASATGNYTGKATATFAIAKATAPVLSTITREHPTNTAASGTVPLFTLLPADCGTATYRADTPVGGAIASGSLDASGNYTYIIINSAAETTASVRISVSMQNYEDATVLLSVHIEGKVLPEGTPSVSETLTYGQPLSKITLKGTMQADDFPVSGSFAWEIPSYLPTAAVTSATWVFIPVDRETYLSVTGDAAITVLPATPAGTPSYTKLTAAGKTLADTGLTGAFTNPHSGAEVRGTLVWNAGATAIAAANTAYTWTFTPEDTANYRSAAGSITPYPVTTSINNSGSGSGGGGGGSSAESSGAAINAITVSTTAHGSLTVSTTTPAQGETVLITVLPDHGYTLDSLSITQSAGTVVTVMDNGDETFSFSYDGVAVSISASFISSDTSVPLAAHFVLPFTDVAYADWYYEAVAYVYQNAFFQGTSDTTFSPIVTTNRAMMVTVLYRLAGSPAPGENHFTDVPDGTWYTDAVSWAASNGIVDGIGDGLFAPNDAITREQMAVMLCRYAQAANLTLPTPRAPGALTDSDTISSWAVESVTAMVTAEILNGKENGAFDPAGKASRAEIAQMLMNFTLAVTA